ncbi:MAG: 50S ribosomal protein L9 [Francisellaceae bacterium]|jgi:large subunit ribosomal protein L9|nr:50S ribosomal protein L9 [Francisellaceae bacterium]MBT6538308.1 50S ribosomal protein L9 [Francisellaceae bacterium]
MKVILLEKIKRLGDLGSEVEVKSGYGRNYLIPNSKAVLATPDNLAFFNEKKAEFEKVATDKSLANQERAKTLDGVVVEITAKVSDEGNLYGSLGVGEIVSALAAKQIEVSKQELQLDLGPIRSAGEHEVKVLLNNGEVEAKIIVKVTGE